MFGVSLKTCTLENMVIMVLFLFFFFWLCTFACTISLALRFFLVKLLIYFTAVVGWQMLYAFFVSVLPLNHHILQLVYVDC